MSPRKEGVRQGLFKYTLVEWVLILVLSHTLRVVFWVIYRLRVRLRYQRWQSIRWYR